MKIRTTNTLRKDESIPCETNNCRWDDGCNLQNLELQSLGIWNDAVMDYAIRNCVIAECAPISFSDPEVAKPKSF